MAETSEARVSALADASLAAIRLAEAWVAFWDAIDALGAANRAAGAVTP